MIPFLLLLLFLDPSRAAVCTARPDSFNTLVGSSAVLSFDAVCGYPPCVVTLPRFSAIAYWGSLAVTSYRYQHAALFFSGQSSPSFDLRTYDWGVRIMNTGENSNPHSTMTVLSTPLTLTVSPDQSYVFVAGSLLSSDAYIGVFEKGAVLQPVLKFRVRAYTSFVAKIVTNTHEIQWVKTVAADPQATTVAAVPDIAGLAVDASMSILIIVGPVPGGGILVDDQPSRDPYNSATEFSTPYYRASILLTNSTISSSPAFAAAADAVITIRYFSIARHAKGIPYSGMGASTIARYATMPTGLVCAMGGCAIFGFLNPLATNTGNYRIVVAFIHILSNAASGSISRYLVTRDLSIDDRMQFYTASDSPRDSTSGALSVRGAIIDSATIGPGCSSSAFGCLFIVGRFLSAVQLEDSRMITTEELCPISLSTCDNSAFFYARIDLSTAAIHGMDGFIVYPWPRIYLGSLSIFATWPGRLDLRTNNLQFWNPTLDNSHVSILVHSEAGQATALTGSTAPFLATSDGMCYRTATTGPGIYVLSFVEPYNQFLNRTIKFIPTTTLNGIGPQGIVQAFESPFSKPGNITVSLLLSRDRPELPAETTIYTLNNPPDPFMGCLASVLQCSDALNDVPDSNTTGTIFDLSELSTPATAVLAIFSSITLLLTLWTIVHGLRSPVSGDNEVTELDLQMTRAILELREEADM